MNHKYVCIECNKEFEADFFKLKCEESDYSCFDIKYYKSNANFPVLPSPLDIKSLGEGSTPVVSFKDKFSDLGDFIFKLEYFSPTGSFKDRGTSLLLSKAKEVGIKEFVEDSSGNAGASMSAYAKNLGMKCHIFVPDQTPLNKKSQIKIFGAELHNVPGPRQNSTIAAKEFCDKTSIPYVSHNYNPYFIEGMKSFAYEIFEEFNDRITDIVIPVGNGSLLIGAYKGFKELKNQGLINKIPKLHCIQVEGFSPISNKFMNLDWEFDVNSKTLAGGIAVSDPPRINQVIDAIKESESECEIVSEEKTLSWHKEIASWGILSEITCAAALAGTEKLLNRGVIGKDSNVIVPITGSGLKDLSNVKI
ncbi:MAG: threonine synthase [Chloroflexota bacterium]|nr:threonine synthase [Chloroflexota bacterium]MEC9451748.1 threonine synthase [Chloroflexota bacterium]MQG04793.1 pyridoxal-phosphate dependent enzyme [SAR202 cluster bacterium]|tara:strand:+ start:3719 stop:4804 length:1086 start_codon:yes stop_codon:yes gene_type:complete